MYLTLNINRDSIVRDAVTQLSGMEIAYPERLKRPLRIKFVGEEVSALRCATVRCGSLRFAAVRCGSLRSVPNP